MRFQKIFCPPDLCNRTADKFVFYYSTHRVEALVNLITAVLMFGLLILPPIVLYRSEFNEDKNSAVSVPVMFVVFTCFFTATMVLVLGVTRHELFAALAVYCAVLATFVGSTGTGQCYRK